MNGESYHAFVYLECFIVIEFETIKNLVDIH